MLTTDAFLHSNAVLSEQGLLMRKGFPESYDLPALIAFVAAMRARSAAVTVPVYSHDTYDIVDGEPDPIPASDVVVIEGVNALSALGASLDLAVYVDADERDIETWFLERFHRLCEAARDDERSFYRMFVGTISSLAAEEKLPAPALFIVGRVASHQIAEISKSFWTPRELETSRQPESIA